MFLPVRQLCEGSVFLLTQFYIDENMTQTGPNTQTAEKQRNLPTCDVAKTKSSVVFSVNFCLSFLTDISHIAQFTPSCELTVNVADC